MRSRYGLGQLARGELAGGDQLGLAREAGEDGVGGRGHGGGGYRAWDDRPLHVTAVAPIAEGLARFEARGPCTDAERRAAAWLHDELRDAGHEAWVETHWVRPQWALSIALHATLGVVASLVAISAPLPGLIAAAVAAVSMAFEGVGLPGLLRLAFPRRATQNVLTVPEEGGVTLLIAAPYAAPRGGFGAAGCSRRGGRSRGSRAALALLVAVCAGLRALDLDGLWLGLLQFVPTIALLLALAAAGDAAVARYVAGRRGAAGGGGRAPRRAAPQPARPPLPRAAAPRRAARAPAAREARPPRDRPARARPAAAATRPRTRSCAPRPRRRAPASGCGGRVSGGVPDAVDRRRRGGRAALDLALACVDALDAELP